MNNQNQNPLANIETDAYLAVTANDESVAEPQERIEELEARCRTQSKFMRCFPTADELEYVWRLAGHLSKSGAVPRGLVGKTADIFAVMLHGAELGVPAMESLQVFAPINGKMTAYGDGLVALCMRHPDWVDMKEVQPYQIDKTNPASCTVCRKDREPVTHVYTYEMAVAAGQLASKGPWHNYFGRMMQMQARSWALRDSFPDALRGIYSAEEAAQIPDDPASRYTQDKPTFDPKPVAESIAAAAPAPDPLEELVAEVERAEAEATDKRTPAELAGAKAMAALGGPMRVSTAQGSPVPDEQADDTPAVADEVAKPTEVKDVVEMIDLLRHCEPVYASEVIDHLETIYAKNCELGPDATMLELAQKYTRRPELTTLAELTMDDATILDQRLTAHARKRWLVKDCTDRNAKLYVLTLQALALKVKDFGFPQPCFDASKTAQAELPDAGRTGPLDTYTIKELMALREIMKKRAQQLPDLLATEATIAASTIAAEDTLFGE